MRPVPYGMLHSERMKQRDLKNPSCRISSAMRHDKNSENASNLVAQEGGILSLQNQTPPLTGILRPLHP
jgi:hypothetical protein